MSRPKLCKFPAEADGMSTRPKWRREGFVPRLSGLSRWREWQGFFFVVLAVFVVIIAGGYILQAVGVW